MNGTPLDRSKADRLVADLLSQPESFEKRGLANELLNEFFHGYPIDHLRLLLHHLDVRVLRRGTWIASELPREAEFLLDDIIAVSKHSDRRIRRDALIVIALGTNGARLERFFHLVEALDDPDAAVAEHALFLLSRSSDAQLAAAITHFETTRQDRHLSGLRMLVKANSADQSAAEAMLQSDDPLRRKYGLALAERGHSSYPSSLILAANSEDESIRPLAQHLLDLHKIRGHREL
jgi:hypothetical protein